MKLSYNASYTFDALPEDVKAVLMLFPDDYELFTGSFYDIVRPGMHVFIQPIGNIKNRKRFISWVRAGMPEGYNTYDNLWTKET